MRLGGRLLVAPARLTFGICGDHETVPDLVIVARGIEQSLSDLQDLAAREAVTA